MAGMLPFTAMMMMECTNVAVKTLYKVATLRGMSYHVFLTYSYAIGALLLLPSIFFSKTSRSEVFPPLSFSIIPKLSLFSLIGYLSVTMGYIGISYSSPTLASAISSLSPAFTFILALLFRMETLALRSSNSSRAKFLGTIVSIAGALVVTLYKGTTIISTPPSLSISLISTQPEPSWVIGALFLTAECILTAVYYIYLAHIMKTYHAQLTVMLFYNSAATIQAGVVGFFSEPDSSVWRIRPDIALVTILCAGLCSTFLRSVVSTWVLHLKGPLFIAMFKPLSMVIAVAIGVLFLGDAMYLGSVVGATIIAIGFYTVMWGKAREDMGEERKATDLESSPTLKTPLLQSYRNQGDTKWQINGIPEDARLTGTEEAEHSVMRDDYVLSMVKDYTPVK